MRKLFLLFFFTLAILSADSQQLFNYCIAPPPLTGYVTTLLSYSNPSLANYTFYYRITLECAQTPQLFPLTIMDLNSRDKKVLSWHLDSVENITGVIDPCLVFASAPCHQTFYYHIDVQMAVYGAGSVAATINCCRPFNAQNMFYEIPYASGQIPCCANAACVGFLGPVSNGIVNFIRLPVLPPGQINSSPQFTSNDTILNVCQNRPFTYHIHAYDVDNDSVAYHFSPPRIFFNEHQGTLPFPTGAFKAGYSNTDPAGPDLSLDPVTGLMQGSIHDTGTFVIPFSAVEYRNGVFLDSIMQDLLVKVYDCSQLPKPKASIPDSLNSCSGFAINFPNNSSPLYPGNNWNNTTFQWDFGDGGSSQLVYPSHTYADTGTYDTRVIIFPGLYCADTAYSKVLVYPYVKSDFSYSQDTCSGQQILFNNTSTSTSGDINFTQWDFKKDSSLLFSTSQYNTAYTFTKAPQTYTVILTVGNTKGCMATDTQYVNINQSPFLLASHDTILTKGATLQLQVNDGNYNYNGQYNWWPPDGLSDPSSPDPVLNSTTDNTYYVTVINSFGCTLQDSIDVKYYSGPDIYVPNAFTPNGDGKNDVFKPVPVGISEFRYFRVYNRYGQLMFHTNKANQGWDGNFNGTQAQQGTYVWEVSGVDYLGKTIHKQGAVILIR